MRFRLGLCGIGLAVIGFASCQREARHLQTAPVQAALFDSAAVETTLRPGGALPPPQVNNPYHGNAYAISEGQRLYNWYNCSGCHFQGGGGIGPPLIKQHWIYGGQPANLFDTIVKGRPNGMPSWGGRIPENQVWEIVAYVRSLNGEQPSAATPPRTDTIEGNSYTQANNKIQGQTK